jgi:hypothetical protein
MVTLIMDHKVIPMEFFFGVSFTELPLDHSFRPIPFFFPGSNLFGTGFHIPYPAVQALSREGK